jgi:single-strand DNA-binding protein
MSSFNKVILMGNLTRDPEVRYTPSGSAVTDLDMAINRRFKKSDGQSGEETCYVNRITVWGRQAENCGQYLKRGSSVLIEGRLRYEQWEKDGQKHNRLGVVAERVQFLGSPAKGTEFGDGGGKYPASNQNSVGGSEPQSQPPVDAGAPPAPPAVQAGEVVKDNPLNDDDDNLPF